MTFLEQNKGDLVMEAEAILCDDGLGFNLYPSLACGSDQGLLLTVLMKGMSPETSLSCLWVLSEYFQTQWTEFWIPVFLIAAAFVV